MAHGDDDGGPTLVVLPDEAEVRARVLLAHAGARTVLAGVVRHLAEAMRGHDLDVDVVPARSVRDVGAYDAVVVGSALVRRRWHRHARRLVRRHADALGDRPVWLFSCLERDDRRSGDGAVRGTRRRASRVDARTHRVFAPDEVAEVSPFVARSAPPAVGDGPEPSAVDRWGAHVGATVAWEHHVRRAVIRGTAV